MSTPKVITAPKVHVLGTNAYGQTQTDDAINDGDVLILPVVGAVGFMCGAWPVVCKGDVRAACDEYDFHTLQEDVDITCIGAHPAVLEDTPWALPADPGTDYSTTMALIDTIPAMRCDGPGMCKHCDAG